MRSVRVPSGRGRPAEAGATTTRESPGGRRSACRWVSLKTLQSQRSLASLDVNEHEVVSLRESTHGWLPTEARMRSGAIVMLQPARQHAGAIGGGVVGPRIGPLTQQSLDEALGFAVRARGIRPRPVMDEAQRSARRAEPDRPIARAIVRENPSHPDAAGTEPRQGAPHEAARRVAAFVGQQLDIRDSRAIIYGHVDDLPAAAVALAAALAGRAVAEIPDPAQLLGVDMEHVANGRVFVALDDAGGLEAAAPTQPAPPPDPGGGARADAQGGGDLRAGPVLPAQDLRRELEGRDRKSTRLNSSHLVISYAVFCLKKKKKKKESVRLEQPTPMLRTTVRAT